MSVRAIKLLLVEDNPGDVDLVREYLADVRGFRFQIEHEESVLQACQRAMTEAFDLVLLDLGLPDCCGLDTFHAMSRACPHLPIVVLTGLEDEETGLETVRKGAQDYLLKRQINSPLLVRSIRYALERKRAEQELRDSENRFRSLVLATSQIVWTAHSDGQVVEDIPSWRAFTGQSCEEIRGAGWLSALHPEDRERALAVWSKAVTNQTHYEAEYRLRRKDGEYRDFTVHVVPVINASGTIRDWVGTCSDVTEQKRAAEYLQHRLEELRSTKEALQVNCQQLLETQHTLEKERQLYRELFELAPIGYVVTTPAGVITQANDGARALFKVKPTQKMIGFPLVTYVEGTARSIFRIHLEELRQGRCQRIEGWEIRLQPRKHPPIDAILTVCSQAIGNVPPHNIRWMIVDISERKRTEALLRQQQDQLQQINRELSENAHLLALQKSEVETKNQQLKQAHTALQEKVDQLARTSRYKSEFLANMSHEIRTPMNGIIGLTGLALDGELTTEQRQYLDGVLLSAESLLDIINSVLDFSKIEAGRMELSRSNFDLRETLGKAVKTLALRAHEKHLELLYEVRPNVPEALIGDPVRLWQIVINLVGNAIKFTQHGEVSLLVELDESSRVGPAAPRRAGPPSLDVPGDGGPALEASLSHPTGSELGASAPRLMGLPGPAQDSVCVRFTISDTGVGIPADKQRGLFQPFVQADSSSTRAYGGTGLGLVISQSLVQMMNGRIWFESQEGHGSQFHFTAHFERQPVSATKPDRRKSSELAGLRVLVVDDSPTNRRFLSDQLTSWGMQPTAVESGPAALKTLHAVIHTRDPFDLILLDVLMPEMDGFAVLEQLGSIPEVDRPTIIVLSSADQRGDIARSRQLGAAAHLQKPSPPSELLNAIVTALGLSRLPTSEQNAPAASAPQASPGRSLRILVVEDTPVNQLLAVRTLEKAGHSVAVANHGEEALAALGRETFDLILMDVQMPIMDGFQATAQIREREAQSGRHIPIVAMTAYALKDDCARCLAAGMDGYVAKPLHTSELFSAIAAAVNATLAQPGTSGERSVTAPPAAAVALSGTA